MGGSSEQMGSGDGILLPFEASDVVVDGVTGSHTTSGSSSGISPVPGILKVAGVGKREHHAPTWRVHWAGQFANPTRRHHRGKRGYEFGEFFSFNTSGSPQLLEMVSWLHDYRSEPSSGKVRVIGPSGAGAPSTGCPLAVVARESCTEALEDGDS